MPEIIEEGTYDPAKHGTVVPTSNGVLLYKSGYVYTPLMTLHKPPKGGEDDHPECPERITKIHDLLDKKQLLKRMRYIQPREATKEECCLVHTELHWNQIIDTVYYSDVDHLRNQKFYTDLSLYLNEHSALCARYAMGSGIELCRAIADQRINNGFAIIRPPGHHAESQEPMGFCLFNNAAAAARWLQMSYEHINKVLILDWDVHHGNGTQEMFFYDENVLYISLHRYEGGTFYPGSEYGSAETVGEGAGQGKCVNIPWEEPGTGDADYIYAFQKVVMPIAYEFAPDFVIVSAGYDAAKGDPLGGGNVTPTGYAHMTAMLSTLAGGKLAVLLEGGYNVDAIASSSLATVKILVGEPVPMIEPTRASAHVTEVVRKVENIQSKYWNCITPQPSEITTINNDNNNQDNLFTPVSEILKSHRTAELWEKYKFVNITIEDEELESYFGNQLLVSNNQLQAEVILLYLHDHGHVHASLTKPTTDLEVEKSYMVDSSVKLIEWAVSKQIAVIDVNVLPSPTGDEKQPLSNSETLKYQRNFAIYVWDNIANMSLKAQSVVIVGEGNGVNAVTSIINQRAGTSPTARKKIKGVIQLPFLNPMKPINKDAPVIVDGKQTTLRDWYYEISRVICPVTHEYVDDEKFKARRFGKLVNSYETRPKLLLIHKFETMIEPFLMEQLGYELQRTEEETRPLSVPLQSEDQVNANSSIRASNKSTSPNDNKNESKTPLPADKNEAKGEDNRNSKAVNDSQRPNDLAGRKRTQDDLSTSSESSGSIRIIDDSLSSTKDNKNDQSFAPKGDAENNNNNNNNNNSNSNNNNNSNDNNNNNNTTQGNQNQNQNLQKIKIKLEAKTESFSNASKRQRLDAKSLNELSIPKDKIQMLADSDSIRSTSNGSTNMDDVSTISQQQPDVYNCVVVNFPREYKYVYRRHPKSKMYKCFDHGVSSTSSQDFKHHLSTIDHHFLKNSKYAVHEPGKLQFAYPTDLTIREVYVLDRSGYFKCQAHGIQAGSEDFFQHVMKVHKLGRTLPMPIKDVSKYVTCEIEDPIPSDAVQRGCPEKVDQRPAGVVKADSRSMSPAGSTSSNKNPNQIAIKPAPPQTVQVPPASTSALPLPAPGPSPPRQATTDPRKRGSTSTSNGSKQ